MLQLKTKAVVLTSLLLVSALIILTNIYPALSNPATLLVPSQYPTIQAAITAAGPGDTIIVATGIYNESNLVITQNGLTLQGESRVNTIIDGQNGNNHVIAVKANNVVVRGFTIRNARTVYKAGIWCNSSSNAYLADNTFSGNFYSVHAQYCTDVKVVSSTFSGDSANDLCADIRIYYCQSGLIENNTILSAHVGAFVIQSSNFMIKNNTFSSSILTGVTVSYSEQNWVARNIFRDNNSSISIKYNGTNTVIGNTISNSATAGLLLQNAPNNVIHHNNLVNNALQVKFLDSSPTTHIWSTSLPIAEGNYWSDYTGTDANKDGIGDTAYNVGTGNQDPYPLIGRFAEFSVTNQTGIYNVYTISNSLIQNFGFDQVARKIDFSVSGTSGTTGICRVVFPKGLVLSPYTVFVNGVNQTYGSAGNSTHVALYFSYVYGSQASSVVIVPEFPAMLILPLLLLLTLLIAALKRKKYSG